MMALTGSLLTVGTGHLLLLLSCLDTSGSVPVSPATNDSLFEPSLFTWQDANFSLVSVNKSVIFWLNLAARKVQALEWPNSVIHLPKEESFWGYLYFRDTSTALVVLEFLPSHWPTTYDIRENYDDTDYCVSIHAHDGIINSVPGYKGKQFRPRCLQCNIWSCPKLKGPCECGYYVINKDPTGNYSQTQRKFIGVRWLDVDDSNPVLP